MQGLLDIIIEKVPPTPIDENGNFKAFLINSWFVKDKGVVLLVDIKSGLVKKGDSIVSCAFKKKYEIFEVGIMNPEFNTTSELKSG